MAVESLQELCDEVCARFGVESPTLEEDEFGNLGFSLCVREVDISIVQSRGATAAALVLVIFGQPPAERELEAWHALLDANFLMLDAGAPSFSRHPLNGDAMLQYACALMDVQAEGFCLSIERMAEIALQWRKDFVLEHLGVAAAKRSAASAEFV